MSDGVTEVYFYHLERRTLEEVLPTLLERSVERGWRATVQAASEERVEALAAEVEKLKAQFEEFRKQFE